MAIIGSVGVRVAPTFTGLGSAVSSAFGRAGRDAGRAISRPVEQSLRTAVRTSITSASTAALGRVESATAGITRAEQNLEKAKRDSERASARAQTAEERLAKLRDSGEASAGQLATAESNLNDAKARAEAASKNLSTAENRVADAKREAATATEQYEAALRKEDSGLFKLQKALPVIGDGFRDAGKRIGDFGKSIGDIGSGLTRKFTLPVLGAVGAVGATVGAMGFNRLVGIDRARAQFQGLGYDAEKVMEQVDKGVTDTALAMNEGAGLAVGALAANVPIDELEANIKRVANTSAAYGVEAEHAGRLINQAYIEGGASYGLLSQMQQNQIPIISALADTYDKTGDEIVKMAQDGEISIEMLNNALDTKAGAAAEEYAGSFAGIAANIRSNIGRAGAAILEGAFPILKETLSDFLDFLRSDDAKAWAQDLGETVANAFTWIVDAVRGAIEWWKDLDDWIKKLIISFGIFMVAIGPILVIFGKIITFVGGIITAFGTILKVAGPVIGIIGKLGGAFALLANPITWIVAGIAALVAGVVWFATQTEIGQQIVSTAWAWIQDAIAAVVDWAVGTAWPALQSAWDGIVAGAQWLWEILSNVWSWVKDAIAAVVDWAVNTAWPMIQSVWDGIVAGAQWLWGILQPIFIMIAAVFLWVGQTLWSIFSTFIKAMWDAFVAIVQFVWNYILKPIFNAIVAAFTALGNAFKWIWDSILKPVFDAFAWVVKWVWNSIIKPIFNAIVAAFTALGNAFKWIWDSILKPVFDAFAKIARWLWENVLRPVFQNAGEAFATMGRWLADVWTNTIRPMIESFGEFIQNLYKNHVRPALDNIQEKWAWLRDTLSRIWNENIKPVLGAFGDFVRDELVARIDRGVEKIKSVWDTVAGLFRTPINWVIDTVWNNGLREAYNTVARLINADELGRIDTLEAPPAFAKGGYHRGGWALVGEEGPELVNFGSPGRVYTAAQTRAALATDSPAGRTPEEHAATTGLVPRNQLPIGGGGNWLTRGAKWVADKTGISKAVDVVRGKVADGFRKMMEPISNVVQGFTSDWGGMGQLSSAYVDFSIDKIASWIDSRDQEQFEGGEFSGKFTANPGGFNRPAGGPVTSLAGPRNLAHGFSNFHWGVDLGAPMGAPVRAAWDGIVRSTGWGPGNLGNLIVLNHGGFETAYAHLSRIGVRPGQDVTGGQVIGGVGASGGPFAPHLHFEKHTPGFYSPDGDVNALFRDKGGLIYPGLNLVQNDTGMAEYAFNRRQFDRLNEMAENGGSGEDFHLHQHMIESRDAWRNVQMFKSAIRKRNFKPAGAR